MKVLVTGSAGFIGYHVAQRLLLDGHEVIGVDNFNEYYDPFYKNLRCQMLKPYDKFKIYRLDIIDKSAFSAFYEVKKPTHVIHLAAQAGVRHSLEKPMDYIQNNIAGFQNVLDCVKNFGSENFVYASSSSVYGGTVETPFREDQICNNPLNIYAASKIANEMQAKSYGNLYDIPNTGLRFFTVYGKHGRPDMAMFKFADAMRKGQTLDIYNKGNMKRDFTYVDDIVDGIIKALEKPQHNQIYNLASGKQVKLLDMITTLESELGYRNGYKTNLLPMQPGDIQESHGDIYKAKMELKYSPIVDIQLGIKRFANWYRRVHG